MKSRELKPGDFYVNYFSDGKINVMKVEEDTSLISEDLFIRYVILYQSHPYFNYEEKVYRHINKTSLLKILFDD